MYPLPLIQRTYPEVLLEESPMRFQDRVPMGRRTQPGFKSSELSYHIWILGRSAEFP